MFSDQIKSVLIIIIEWWEEEWMMGGNSGDIRYRIDILVIQNNGMTEKESLEEMILCSDIFIHESCLTHEEYR